MSALVTEHAIDRENLEDLGGSVIASGSDLSVTYYKDYKVGYVFLEKLIGRENNKAIHDVVDYISVPQPKNGFGMIWYGTCWHESESLPWVIAVVEKEDKEYLRNVVRAWSVNLASETIFEISTEGIYCYNDGWVA